MISRGFKWTLFALFVVVGVSAIVVLRLDNARLRNRIAAQQGDNARASRLRAENQRMQQLLARTRADAADGPRAVREEATRLRAEIRELELRAEQARGQIAARETADRAALTSNRDLRAGLVALEHLSHAGQSTPAAAWQTFVWATANRREDLLATMLVVSPEGRARAEQLIGDMPEAERAHWTPEKLGRQFFNGVLGQTKALEIAGEALTDAQHATLRLRLRGRDDATFEQPMQLGPAGWRVVITEQPIAAVQKRLRLIAEREGRK